MLSGVVGSENWTGHPFGQPIAQLIAGSTTLTNYNTIPRTGMYTGGNQTGLGIFETWSLIYTSASSVSAGQTMQVLLQQGTVSGPSDPAQIVDFDNIALAYGYATTSTLTSGPNPWANGGTVIFTNTVTSVSGTPTTGTVTFYDNGTNTLGTGSVNSSGVATLTTSALTVGTHSITAVYGGGGSYGGSIASALSQTVTPSARPVRIS